MSGIEGGGLPPPGSGQGGAGQPSGQSGNQPAAQSQAATQGAAQQAAAQQAAQAGRGARGEADRGGTAREAQAATSGSAGGGAQAAPAPPVRAEGLAQLIAQGTTRATVVGHDAAGQAVVRTSAGHFVLVEAARTGAGAAAPGQEVTLRLVPAPATARGGVVFALLTGAGGATASGPPVLVRPEALSAQALARLGILLQPAGGSAGAPPDPFGPHRLTATFLAPSATSGGGATTGGAPSWAAGQAFGATVRIAGPAVPGTGGGPPGMAPGAIAAGAMAAGAMTAGGGGGAVLTGRVLGPGPSGGTVVQTPAGTFLLQTARPWPVGLTLGLALQATGDAAPAAGGASQGLGRGWPALDAAMTQLAAQQPALAAALRNGALPGPNSGFAAALLAFISALRGGGLQSWLGGDAARALERGPLGAQLADDLNFLSMLFDERLEGEWRMLPLPYADGERLRQIAIYMRDRREKRGGSDPGSRFVFALDLTTTGALQIDGLVRERRLDLALRTALPVPRDWQTDLLAIFDDAMAITGMTGRMVFQHGREALLDLPQPAAADRPLSA